MDRRVRILRFWLLFAALSAVCLYLCPAAWFALAPLGMAHIWTRTSGGSTGILIHPTGPPWAIAVGDAADTTCECCGTTGCSTRCDESPDTITLVIAGLTTGTGCTESVMSCAAYNTTYVIDDGEPKNCVATSTISRQCNNDAGSDQVSWFFTFPTSPTELQVQMIIRDATFDQTILFAKDLDGSPATNCVGLDSEDIPFVSSTGAGSACGVAGPPTCTATTSP